MIRPRLQTCGGAAPGPATKLEQGLFAFGLCRLLVDLDPLRTDEDDLSAEEAGAHGDHGGLLDLGARHAQRGQQLVSRIDARALRLWGNGTGAGESHERYL
jgi:hypothetical protein